MTCAILVGMERAWYWRLCCGRDQWCYVALGALAGISLATFARPPDDDPIGWIVLHFVLSALVGTAVIVGLYWRDRVPSDLACSSADRPLVVRSVARGEAPHDPQLALPVAQMAAHIRRNDDYEPESANGWSPRLAHWFGAVVVLARVVVIAADGNILSVATLAGCALLVVLLHRGWRTQRDDIWAKAEQAEAAATAQLTSTTSPPPLR